MKNFNIFSNILNLIISPLTPTVNLKQLIEVKPQSFREELRKEFSTLYSLIPMPKAKNDYFKEMVALSHKVNWLKIDSIKLPRKLE